MSYSRPRSCPCASPPPSGNHDGDHGGNAFLGDQVVEDPRQVHVGLAQAGAIVRDDERRGGAGHILRGNVNGDRALVVDRVRFDDQRLRVVGIERAEHVAGNARVEEFAVLRVDAELLHLPLRNAFDDLRLRRRHILGTDDEIAFGIDRRIHAGLAVETGELRRTGRIERARRRLRSRRRLSRGRLRRRCRRLWTVGTECRSEQSERGCQTEEQRGEARFHECAWRWVVVAA